MKRRSLRGRVTAVITFAVALAVAVSAMTCWLVVSNEMHRQLVQSLESFPVSPHRVEEVVESCGRPGTRPNPFGAGSQVVLADGTVCLADGTDTVPPTEEEKHLAVSGGDPILREGVTEGGVEVLVFTRRLQPGDEPGPGVAVSAFRPIEEMESTLNVLALVLGAVAVTGVLGAALMGLWLARTALRPVERLTTAVEHIARTEDLGVRIPVEGTDEIARLSRSFNTMTTALAGSQERQRQLVSDAGHELRTPLTSLRTNIDLLLRSETTGRAIDPDAKRRLLVNVKEQFEEMSTLIGDLLELARNTETGELSADVEFHQLVAEAVARAKLRGPGLGFDVDLRPWTVHGDARGLQRAAVNVLDNAVKFSPPGGVVTVRLADGVLTVRDQGPGVPEDELPYVFERFWRSTSARSLPGAGLGLAIVARAVRDCGGEVRLENADGGGTLVTIILNRLS